MRHVQFSTLLKNPEYFAVFSKRIFDVKQQWLLLYVCMYRYLGGFSISTYVIRLCYA